MKVSLLLIIIAFASNAFGQVAPGKQLAKVTDTTKISVFYETLNPTEKALKQANYYINNVSYGNLTPFFNPENIESINVEKEGSKILITLKSGYQPNFITLDQLREKYVDSKNQMAIYILEGSLVRNNLQLIDEKYVLAIKVSEASELLYLKDKVKGVDVINITFKTEANLDKANTIYIRGNSGLGK